MPIRDWTTVQLTNLIDNYDNAGVVEGGLFTRAEAQIELERRRGGEYDGREAALAILTIQSEHGQVSYNDIWHKYNPDIQWNWPVSLNTVRKILHAAAYYCAANNLPIVTALVGQDNGGNVTEQAKQNMYDAALNWGVAQGNNADEFYAINLTALAAMSPENLP